MLGGTPVLSLGGGREGPKLPGGSRLFIKSPPVVPTGAINSLTSRQVGVKKVFPVQRHIPLIQAPLLLQWKAQDCLF